MTSILLYWNHICVLHRQEKAFLEDLAQRLWGDGIRWRCAISVWAIRSICPSTWPGRMPYFRTSSFPPIWRC